MNYENYSDEVIQKFFEENYIEMTHYVGENRKGYKEYVVVVDMTNLCICYDSRFSNRIKLEMYDDSDNLTISLCVVNFYDMDCNESFISLTRDFELNNIRHRYEFNTHTKEDRRDILLTFKTLIEFLQKNLLNTKLKLEMKDDNFNNKRSKI